MADEERRQRQNPGQREKRRGGGLRALSVSLPAASKKALGRRGFADASLLAEWRTVVGRDLARSSEPLRLTFPNPRERVGGTLLLRVEPAFAPILQHLEPQLLERVNGFFGYRAVEAVRIRQGRIREETGDSGSAETEEEPALRQSMTDRLERVPDETLRKALGDLAKRFQARNRKGG
jgi:hypothetical protein